MVSIPCEMSRLPSFDFSGLSFHVPVKSAAAIVPMARKTGSTFRRNGNIRRRFGIRAVRAEAAFAIFFWGATAESRVQSARFQVPVENSVGVHDENL